jgi:hypothetical protein
VVVNDLDPLGTSVGPREAEPPLVIDSDAVLAGSVSFQGFEPVPGREPEILQNHRSSQLAQLAQRDTMNPRIECVHAFAAPQSLGVLVAERLDHTIRI